MIFCFGRDFSVGFGWTKACVSKFNFVVSNFGVAVNTPGDGIFDKILNNFDFYDTRL